MPNLNISIMSGIPVFLPPLPEQRAIASVLGSLDDKIEANRRMNRTLEAMARTLFRSWFVDFDPVRAKADGHAPAGLDAAMAALFPDRFEASPLGNIPAGWRLSSLGEVVGLNERAITRGYPHERIEYVDISSVTAGTLDTTTPYALGEAPSRAKRLVEHGDTIWSCVRPNHKSYLFIHSPPENLVVSTGFVVLCPRSVTPEFLYGWTTTADFVDYLTMNADGSAYPAVRPDHFERAPILIPSGSVLDNFEAIVSPLRDRMAANTEKSRTLAALRDGLLPRLVSGTLRVT